MKTLGAVLAGALLALGIAGAGYFGSQTIVNGRVAVNIATVKGLAERVVPADTANWSISFDAADRSLTRADTERLFARATEKRDAIIAVLQEAGFDDSAYAADPLRYSEVENRDYQGKYTDTTYAVAGKVTLRSTDLDKTKAAYFAMADLPRQGLTVSINPPQYLFTGLNDIKPDMLREATANARIAAEEFAADAGVSVGGIQNATQGGFSVQDVGPNQYGETEALEKIVRVVTTITFYLEN